jgi:hypothetical protein
MDSAKAPGMCPKGSVALDHEAEEAGQYSSKQVLVPHMYLCDSRKFSPLSSRKGKRKKCNLLKSES